MYRCLNSIEGTLLLGFLGYGLLASDEGLGSKYALPYRGTPFLIPQPEELRALSASACQHML